VVVVVITRAKMEVEELVVLQVVVTDGVLEEMKEF
jgi:hypothetical protein